MKGNTIIYLIFIFLLSNVLSNEEGGLKFLTLGKNEKSFRNQPNTYEKNLYLENISEKQDDEIHKFFKSHSNNKLVNLLGYPVDAQVSNVECDNLRQILTSFNEQSFQNLSNCLNAHLKSPLQLDNLNFILLKIRKTAQSNRLESTFKLAFNERETVNFFEIIVNQHSKNLKTKILSLKSSAFENEKLFIFKSNDNENYYYAESLASLSEKEQIEELSTFMNYLEILSTRESVDESLIKILKSSPKVYTASAASGSFDLLTKIFEKVKGGWTTLLSVFHNSSETTIKKLFLDTGYSKYDNSVQVQILQGVRKDGLQTLYDLLEKRIKVPEARRTDVSGVLQSIEWSDTNAWANFDIAFSLSDGAEVKFVSIFANRGQDDTFNFVITEVFATFNLAPEIMIVTKKLSILGGLWSQRSVELQYTPQLLNNEDLENVFNFFQIIIYKHVASQFGINLDLPN
jgi:hypothetical protein